MSTEPMTYWTCENAHQVLDCYMPESGTVCNVVGCEGTREQVSDEVPDYIASANTVIAHLYKQPLDEVGMDLFKAQVILEQMVHDYLHANSDPD